MNYLINSRTLTTLNPADKELLLDAEKNYLFELPYLGVLDVSGEKALDFLQGQLTCDVSSVSDITMIQGAQCNLKGRILTLIDVVSWQGLKLVLPMDLMEASINSLNKTAMLSRVSLKENKALQVFGFYLQNHKDTLFESAFFPDTCYGLTYGADYCAYHLGHGFYLILAQAEFAKKAKQLFTEKKQILGSLTWHSLRLAKQQINLYPESRGLFLPHRLNLHQTPYLSFNKGCYKGQEIIARMHYKATLKHELKLFSIKTSEKIYSGQKILSGIGGTELGEVVDLSIVGKNHYLVALSILKGIESLVLFEGHSHLEALMEP